MSLRLPSRFLLVLVAALLLTLTACNQGEPAAPPQAGRSTPKHLVDPDAFAEALLDPRRVVINVHTPDEGSISGTDLTIPFAELSARSDELPADTQSPLAVYCRSGNMSETAVDTRTDMG